MKAECLCHGLCSALLILLLTGASVLTEHTTLQITDNMNGIRH